MKIRLKKSSVYNLYLALSFFLAPATGLFAQSISGPVEDVCPNQRQTYGFVQDRLCSPSREVTYRWSSNPPQAIQGSKTGRSVAVIWPYRPDLTRGGGGTISVVVTRGGDACQESANASVTFRQEVFDEPPQKPTLPNIGGESFCPEDMITLSTTVASPSSNYGYAWDVSFNNGSSWTQFDVTSNPTATYTVPRVSSSSFPLDMAFRVRHRHNVCTGVSIASDMVTAMLFPPAPVVTMGVNESPSCPDFYDGKIVINSLDGEVTDYVFTLCELGDDPTNLPVNCFNFVLSRPTVDAWMSPLVIDTTIMTLNNIETAGPPQSTLRQVEGNLLLTSQYYEIFIEPQGTELDRCFYTSKVFIPPAPELSIMSATGSTLTCLGGSNGVITVTTEHGTGDFTYEVFDNPQRNGTPVNEMNTASNVITGLPFGTYYVRVTDDCPAGGQVAEYGPVQISNPTNPFAITQAEGIDILCATETTPTGSATVTTELRNGNVTYELLDNNMSLVETGSNQDLDTYTFTRQHASGNYTVRATDGNGCVATAAVIISTPPALNLTASHQDILCRDADDGSITIVAQGGRTVNGSNSYQYSIDGGLNWSDDDVFPGLTPGEYATAVRDATVNSPFLSCFHLGDTITIIEPATSVSITSITEAQSLECYGDGDARLLVEVSGGTPGPLGYTFRIFDGSSQLSQGSGVSSFEFDQLLAGNYRIEVEDGNGNTFGCTTFTDIEVTQPDLLNIQSAAPLAYVGGNNVSCNGLSDGEVTIITTGGIYPHEVSMNGESQTINNVGEAVIFANLPAATYTMSVVDFNGCVYNEDIILTEPDPLVIDGADLLTYIGGNNISCFGESDGELTVTTLGGILPHTVSVNGENKQITATNPSVTFTGLSAITYSILVTDANGCTVGQNTTLTEPLSFEVFNIDTPTVFGGNNLECNGDSDAIADIRTTGGTYPHEVTLGNETQVVNSPTELATFIGLAAGNYNVSIVDANGCLNDENFIITEPDLLVLDSTKTVIVQPLCFGENTSSITLEAIGGTLISGNNYHYEIDHQNVPDDLPFAFDAHQEMDGVNVTFDELIAGEYLVSLYDHFDCFYQETIIIESVNQIDIDIQTTDIVCKGETSGIASLVLNGGTAPYTVSWQNAQRQTIETDIVTAGEIATIENLGEALYNFRISDASGCEYFQAGFNFAIEGPAQALDLTASVQEISCNGENDGLIQLQAVGGWQEQAYEYGTSLDDLSIANSFHENLTPGEYKYYVRDSRGCIDSLEITIVDPDILTLNTTSVESVTCNGLSDGSVILDAQGGRLPYAFSLDGIAYQNLPTFDSLVAGMYTFEVQDASGCSALLSLSVTEPDVLIVDVTVTGDTQCGENEGTAQSQVTGGTEPYIYRWFDENENLISSMTDIDSLFGADYRLEVEDANGCISSEDFEIVNTNDIIIEINNVTSVTCFGGSNGAIDISVLQFTPPLNISWSHGANTANVSGLAAGIYTVTFSDAAGCDVTETIEITSPDALGLTIVQNQIPTCFEGCDGMLEVSAVGGTAPYSYQWLSGGQTTPLITGQCAGNYVVEITDANGCVYQESITLDDASEIQIGLAESTTICEGQVVNLDAGEWQSYDWSSANGFTSTDRTVTLIEPGQYQLQVIDSNGCTAITNHEVIVSNDLLDADFLMPDEGFVGDTVVCIDISYPLVDNISWEYNESAFNTLREDGPYLDLGLLQEGTYSITMTANLGGCQDEQVYDLTVRPAAERGTTGGRLGFVDKGLKKYTVYPNPSSGVFWTDIELHQEGDIQLTLLNLSGNRTFYEYTGTGQKEYQIRIEADDIPQGIYLLSLITPDESKVVRVFID